ncbi:MAG: hypothetical protein ACK4K9_10670 [Bacteroidia bacterium]
METLNSIKPVLLSKEQLNQLTYTAQDVLSDDALKAERLHKLQKAMILGNSEDHVKVTIIFKSREGFFRVETTVWAVGDTTIQLKANVFIPIGAILDVVF